MARVVGITPLAASEVTASVTQTVGGSPVALASGTLTPDAVGTADADFIVQFPTSDRIVPKHGMTIGSLSNVRMFKGQSERSMEPFVVRTRGFANNTDASGVTADFDRLAWTNNGSIAEGLFDGGEFVQCRVINGVWTEVRTGTIPEGGHRMSAWQRLENSRDMLPADATSYRIMLPDSAERGRAFWIGIAALDDYGRANTPSYVSINTPSSGWDDSGTPTTLANRVYARFYRDLVGAFAAGQEITNGTVTGTIRAVTAVTATTGYVLIEPTVRGSTISTSSAITTGTGAATFNSTAVPGGPPASFGDAWLPSHFETDLSAPSGLSVTSGTTADNAVISWTAVSGARGYMVLIAYEDPATDLRGYGLTLDEDTDVGIRASDVFFVSKKILQPTVANTDPLSRGGPYNGSTDPLTNHTVRVPALRDSTGDRIYYDNKPASGSIELVEFTDLDASPNADCNTAYLKVSITANLPWEDRWTQWSVNGTASGREKPKSGYRYRLAAWVRTASGTKRVWLGPQHSEMQSVLNGWVADTADVSHPNRDDGLGFGEFDIDTDWREIVVDFWVPSDYGWFDSNTLGSMVLRFTEAGEYHVGVFRAWELGPAESATGAVIGGEDLYGDMTRVERERTAESPLDPLRYHGGVKAFWDAYDVAGLTNLPGCCNGGTFQDGETTIQQVRMAIDTGKAVWFQPPFHFSRAEWIALMQYMAQPYDPDANPLTDTPALKPWAAKRYAQRVRLGWTPYTNTLVDELPKILWELGNETWNAAFFPWIAPNGMIDAATGKKYSAGEALGLMIRHMIDSFATLDFWDDIKHKFSPVAGGQSNNLGFGADAAKIAPNITHVTGSGYVQGWDEGGEVPREWEGGVVGNPDFDSIDAMMKDGWVKWRLRGEAMAAIVASINAGRSVDDPEIVAAMHEFGPGYIFDANQIDSDEFAAQLRVKTSLPSATSLLDVIMLLTVLGYQDFSYFAWNSNETFGAFAPTGLRADANGQFFLPVKLLHAVNENVLPGRILPVHTAGVRTRDDIPGMPRAAAYAFRPGDDATKLAVIVINRDMLGYPDAGYGEQTIRIRVPVLSCTGLKRLSFPLDANWLSQNGNDGALESPAEDGWPFADLAIETESLPIPSDPRVLTIAGMPPASAQIYLWEGIGGGLVTPVSYGALTLAGAGGLALPDGATSITDAGDTNLVVSSGYVVPDTGGGVTGGTILFNDGTRWDVTAEANTYSARTVADLNAIGAISAATKDGKTIKARPGDYFLAGSTAFANSVMPTRLTFTSHDLTNRAVFYGHVANGADVQLSGAANLRFDGLVMRGRYQRGVDGDADYAFRLDGDHPGLTFVDCDLQGDLLDLGPGIHLRGFIGGDGRARSSGDGITIDNCRVSGLQRALNLPRGKKTVTRSEFFDVSGDGIVVASSLEDGITDNSGTIVDNKFHSPFIDVTDIVFSSTGRLSRASDLTSMTDATSALLHLRFKPLAAGVGTVRTLLALGNRFEVTLTAANALRVVAQDTSGNTVIDMTSARTFGRDLQVNALISIDTAGTSRMWTWREADRIEASEATATAAGQTLDFTGGSVSVGAQIDNAQQCQCSISVVAMWDATTADLTSSAVRQAFYESSKSGLPKARPAIYGTPPLDIRATLREWRQGTANKGDGGALTISATVDTPHFDLIQWVTNTSSQSETEWVSPANWLIAGNVFASMRFDSLPSQTNAQIIFAEDINPPTSTDGARVNNYYYENWTVRDNLMVTASSHGISISSAKNCLIANNTAVVFNEWADVINSQSPLIRTLDHFGVNPENNRIVDNIARSVSADGTGNTLDNNRAAEAEDVGGANAYATIFAASSFDPATLTGPDDLRTMFATREANRTAYAVRDGWDGYATFNPYVAGASPRSGLSDAISIAAVTGAAQNTAIESAVITPTGVSVSGVVVIAPGADVRLLSAGDVILRDYAPGHVVLLPGQKFRLRRTSAGTPLTETTTTVYCGDETATWSITTAGVTTIFDWDGSTNDIASWTITNGLVDWVPANTNGYAPPGIRARNGAPSGLPAFNRTFSGLTIGNQYRVEVGVIGLVDLSHNWSYSLGRTGSAGAYINDRRQNTNGTNLGVLFAWDDTITLSVETDIKITLVSRRHPPEDYDARVNYVRITEL